MASRLDQRALADLLDGSEVGRELERQAIRVEGNAIRQCPVDTGRLRSSITHALETDSDGLVAKVGTNVEYAAFVELGTSRMRAQPYLRPALYQERGRG